MSNQLLSLKALQKLFVAAFVRNHTSQQNAEVVARCLVQAEVDGQIGHGAVRVPAYIMQALGGKVDGLARPFVEAESVAAIRINANSGFAAPAIKLAQAMLIEKTPAAGIAAVGIANSHHSGVGAQHVEELANNGLIGLSFGNSPHAIAPWGGNKSLFGTNPIAFAAPRVHHAPLIIDMSLSKVARGKINVAAGQGEAIPEGWAVDKEGLPTTNAAAALAGSMLPMGDAKGAQLVLMVEILAAALTASHFGFEASSFFSADGPAPHVGQFMLAIAPATFSNGCFAERLECLLTEIESQPGTRLPGQRRHALRKRAHEHGVEIPLALYQEISELAGLA